MLINEILIGNRNKVIASNFNLYKIVILFINNTIRRSNFEFGNVSVKKVDLSLFTRTLINEQLFFPAKKILEFKKLWNYEILKIHSFKTFLYKNSDH